jgi:hypothetical protein
MLKQKLERLEQKLGGQEPVVIVFVDEPGPELTPEIERRLVDEARKKDPHAPVLFIEWPVPGSKRKKRGSAVVQD